MRRRSGSACSPVGNPGRAPARAILHVRLCTAPGRGTDRLSGRDSSRIRSAREAHFSYLGHRHRRHTVVSSGPLSWHHRLSPDRIWPRRSPGLCSASSPCPSPARERRPSTGRYRSFHSYAVTGEDRWDAPISPSRRRRAGVAMSRTVTDPGRAAPGWTRSARPVVARAEGLHSTGRETIQGQGSSGRVR